jgi:hypothetical protein
LVKNNCLQLPEADTGGYRPVMLETFVEIPRFKGTAYKAANWIHVGQTQAGENLANPWRTIFQ